MKIKPKFYCNKVLAETTEAIESNLNKETLSLSNNDEYDEAINDLNGLDLPRNISTDDFIEEQALKTPQLASELFKRLAFSLNIKSFLKQNF